MWLDAYTSLGRDCLDVCACFKQQPEEISVTSTPPGLCMHSGLLFVENPAGCQRQADETLADANRQWQRRLRELEEEWQDRMAAAETGWGEWCERLAQPDGMFAVAVVKLAAY